MAQASGSINGNDVPMYLLLEDTTRNHKYDEENNFQYFRVFVIYSQTQGSGYGFYLPRYKQIGTNVWAFK